MTDKEFRNKCIKYYFTECLVGEDIDLSKVDGSDDFSCIPRNSRGIVQVEVGDFKDIVSDIVNLTRQHYGLNFKDGYIQGRGEVYRSLMESKIKVTDKKLIIENDGLTYNLDLRYGVERTDKEVSSERL